MLSHISLALVLVFAMGVHAKQQEPADPRDRALLDWMREKGATFNLTVDKSSLGVVQRKGAPWSTLARRMLRRRRQRAYLQQPLTYSSIARPTRAAPCSCLESF